MIRPIIHLLLHLIIPGIIARWAFKGRWKSAWGIMVLTMIIDLDHLFANPVYDPTRCSIGFHPLHTYAAALCYLFLLMLPKTRIVGTGLLTHIALDGIDCMWMG
jgi:hypothetical protein